MRRCVNLDPSIVLESRLHRLLNCTDEDHATTGLSFKVLPFGTVANNDERAANYGFYNTPHLEETVNSLVTNQSPYANKKGAFRSLIPKVGALRRH